MSNPSAPPARFRRVPSGLLPKAVKINGTIYECGPLNSPPGSGCLPADLLAARNVARVHLSMARQLLSLTAGLSPQEYLCRVSEERMDPLDPLDPDGPKGLSRVIPNEMANLAHEITCQTGAEVVSALFDQFTAANPTGLPVNAGIVTEDNAHATAFAVANQVADEVLGGRPLSVGVDDLDRLQDLVEREGINAAARRAKGAETPAGQAADGSSGTTAGDSGAKTPADQAGPAPGSSPVAQLTAVERAMLIYSRDPNQSLREVARKVPCDPSLLSRDPKFKRLREAHQGSVPKGSKSKEGTVEAEDE